MNTPEKPLIVLLNAPKGSGKSSVIEVLDQELGYRYDTLIANFKDKLEAITPSFFGVNDLDFKYLYFNRETKDTPHKDLTLTYPAFQKLQGVCDAKLTEDRWACEHKVMISPREAYIYVAECLMKPSLGIDCFAQGFIEACLYDPRVEIVLNDSFGFTEEIDPLIEEFGKENIVIVQLQRKGFTSWEGDSRNWVNVDGITTHRVTNNGTVEECAEHVLNFIMACLELRGATTIV